MSMKICRGSHEHMDVAHYCIEEFMYHDRCQELIDKGEAMKFLSGMIHRSFHSSTSRYHTLYRQKGKVHSLKPGQEPKHIEYDYEVDTLNEAIIGLLEDMKGENQEMWYQATLFEMYLDQSNYSEISRKTGIPRTSISQAVNECKEYIKQELKNRNITK